jgi:hypothetical protein
LRSPLYVFTPRVVKFILQYQGRGLAIHPRPVSVTLGGARRTAGPAPRDATDSAFGSFASQPFVAVAEGQTRRNGRGLGPLARSRRLRALPATHVERQSHDQYGRPLFGGKARYHGRVRAYGLGAGYRGEGRGNASRRIANGDADSPLAKVNAQEALRIVGGRIPGRGHRVGVEMAVGAGGDEPAGDGDAGSEPNAAGVDPPGEAAADPAGDTTGDTSGAADGDSEAEGGLPLPTGPPDGGLLATTGLIGLALAPGEVRLPLAVGGRISWTSIRKSKEGIVEAQSGETEMPAVP